MQLELGADLSAAYEEAKSELLSDTSPKKSRVRVPICPFGRKADPTRYAGCAAKRSNYRARRDHRVISQCSKGAKLTVVKGADVLTRNNGICYVVVRSTCLA